MAVVDEHTRREMIPHEPTEWMEFRDLSGYERIEARQVRRRAEQRESMERIRELADPAKLYAELLNDPALSAVFGLDQQKAEPEPFALPAGPNPDEFDLETVLRYGIVDWSYGVPCDDAHKRRLDEPTMLWARDQIVSVRLSGVALKND